MRPAESGPHAPLAPEESARIDAGEMTVDARTRERILRSLLGTFIVITLLIAIVGATTGSPEKAVISAVGCAVYVVLLLATSRLGVGPASYLTTAWYLLLASGAMIHGRGIYDITAVLFPPGILMGALLLRSSHLLPLIALSTGTVTAIGAYRLATPDHVALPPNPADLIVVTLLMLVSGALTRLIVRNLQGMLRQRERASRDAVESKFELQQRNEVLQLANHIAATLHRNMDTEAVARETAELLSRYGEAPSVAFYLLEGMEPKLRLVAAHGFTDEERTLGAILPIEGSLSGLAVRERRVVTTEKIGSDARAHPDVAARLASRGLETVLAIPLMFESRALGTLNLIFSGRRELRPIDLESFQAIAQTVALAITNAQHVEGLEYQAFHDSLTLLPNRASLHHRFIEHRETAAREGSVIGFALLDLDQFRQVNEALGHSVGDELLMQIAARLAAFPSDRSEVFRLGGDEFAILLLGLREPEEADSRAGAIHALLREPTEVGGIAIELAASMGVSLYPLHGDNSHDLLRCADVAMYRAKQTGRGVVTYSPDLDRHTPARIGLMADLTRAIREGGLQLHFQPTVALETGSVVGFEALLRWPHPRLGLLQPADFVPLAEATEVINQLTWWVAERALAQLRIWSDSFPHLRMSINLSARNLLDRSCAERLAAIIRNAGVEPSRVEFELTETAIIADPDAALQTLLRITSGGARLAIDDFGTGYSSLAYLQRFPLHAIKIDKTFVADMSRGEQSAAIVRSTVHLARSLGLNVIAEGIEDRETAAALREIGCDLAQGFYFASPGEASAVEHFLTGPTLRAASWGAPPVN